MKTLVTLIGAGPGDPELLTIKGLKALRRAKVVLYDALSSIELLDYAPNALHVFVGKRAGLKRYTQERIQELLVEYAHTHGNVVRLKGGDSYVFGRGFEEKEYVTSHGIPVEVIPGISSSIALPAAANIPVTLRGASQSFWVITATTKERTLSQDIYLAAQSTATVVLLMGRRRLAQIASIYEDIHRGDTPAAVIQSGTTVDQRVVAGPISALPALADAAGLGTPAIIVIGENAQHAITHVTENKQEILAHHAA